MRGCWHAGGERCQPVYGSFFFGRNPVNAVKKVFISKIRKSSPHSTLKDAGALRWEKFFFAPLFTANLTLFFDQTSIRDSLSFAAKQAKSETCSSKTTSLCIKFENFILYFYWGVNINLKMKFLPFESLIYFSIYR